MSNRNRESGEAAMRSIGDTAGVSPQDYADRIGFIILGSLPEKKSELDERFTDYVNSTTVEERISNAQLARARRLQS